MEITFAFGKTGLTIELPAGPSYIVLQSRSATPIHDVQRALADALDHPIGSPGIQEIAQGRRTAAIAVCDITRPAPNAVTLPPLLERLQRGGISKENITIQIATGLHRPATNVEIEEILGQSIAANYRVVNHDAKDFESHAAVGATRGGTPIYIDSRFVSADLHITLGFVEQHLMAGFSGGRKLIAPGLAAQETIKVLHSPRFMRDPKATEGSIEENPLHAELVEIASLVRHDFILDVALTKSREIAGIFAGSGIAAHAAAVEFVLGSQLEELPDTVDAVITSAAGYPLDLTFYQTVKGITAAQHILRPGGKILVLSECSEGVGAPEFAEKLAHLSTYEDYLDQLEESRVQVDQWQLEKLALVGRRFEILFFIPGISPHAAPGLASRFFSSPLTAIEGLLRTLKDNPKIALIPDGPYVFAKVQSRTFA